MPIRHLPSMLLAFVVMLIVAASAGAEVKLAQHTTRHYIIHSNLSRAEMQAFGRYVDRVFSEYQKLFATTGLQPSDTSAMPLYLFATQAQYQDFLSSHGVNAANTSGMFFRLENVRGLATYIRGRSVTESSRTLQHEGFHQFANGYIGIHLPIWVNEGLAQYYEDGIFTARGAHMGVADARRIASVKAAIASNQIIEFDDLLSISSDDWNRTLSENPKLATLHYDQSWSIVYFLIHGENGKYRKLFEQYLIALGKGTPSEQAFEEAFGTTDTKQFRIAWQRFAEQHQPDPLSLAIDRLDFLARAIAFLYQRGEEVPADMAALRARLQRINYRLIRTTPGGLKMEIAAADDELYTYTQPNGEADTLVLLGAQRSNLLPRIAAPNIRPAPTVNWHRDPDGNLVHEIVFQ